MRPLLSALMLLVLYSGAQAADLTRLYADYLTGKAAPNEISPSSTDLQAKVWWNPAHFGAKALMLLSKSMSRNLWILVIIEPSRPATDYYGSTRLRFLGKLNTLKKVSAYRIESGRYQGFYVEDGLEDGRHMLSIFTPEMAAVTEGLKNYTR
jgi:hypothetical protein